MNISRIQKKRKQLNFDYEVLLIQKKMHCVSFDTMYSLSKKPNLSDQVILNIQERKEFLQNALNQVKSEISIIQKKQRYYKKLFKYYSRIRSQNIGNFEFAIWCMDNCFEFKNDTCIIIGEDPEHRYTIEQVFEYYNK